VSVGWMVLVGRGAERRRAMAAAAACAQEPAVRRLRCRARAPPAPTRSRVEPGPGAEATIAHDRANNADRRTARIRSRWVVNCACNSFAEAARVHALSCQAARSGNTKSSAQRTRMRASRNASPGVTLIRCAGSSSLDQASSNTRGLTNAASSRSWPNRNGAAL
jgi:hypothetical protein